MKYTRITLLVICIILVLIPFLWLKPGEMDLGGDSTRLYFYDPSHYLEHVVLYARSNETAEFLILPFNLLLILAKALFKSSYFIITLFNSAHLVVAFLCMYAITRELLDVKNMEQRNIFPAFLAAFFTGLFYIFGPIMTHNWWDRAILVHPQIFINPLMFLLILRYFLTKKGQYLLIMLLLSFVFSFNFSWFAAPYFFSFYPLAIGFLILHGMHVRKASIRKKELLFFCLLFLALQAFHLLPLFGAFLDKSGLTSSLALSESGKFTYGLEYFFADVPHVSLTRNLLGVPQSFYNPELFNPTSYALWFFVFPAIYILGFLFNRNRTYLLLGACFLIVLFFATAKITNVGLSFYASLFDIPGFAMFRSFYSKWLSAYIFFISLFIGYSLFYVFSRLKNTLSISLFSFLTVLVLIIAIPFIRGDIIRIPHYPIYPEQTKAPIKMDPLYEEMLKYIRSDPVDGKFLSIPHTDFYSSVVAGKAGGAYFGPSMIFTLTGRLDINGRSVLQPFSDTFIELVAQKDYRTIENLFSLLAVRYIFYNSDERIYKYYIDWPYRDDIRKFFPPDNKEIISDFVQNVSAKEKISFGNNYHIYQVRDEVYLPRLYVAKKVDLFDKEDYFTYIQGVPYTKGAFYKNTPDYERRTVFLEQEDGKQLQRIAGERIPKITITKVNPTRYSIEVRNAADPYMLVFSESFHPRWQLFLAKGAASLKQPIVAQYFNGEIVEAKPINEWVSWDTFSTWGQKPVVDSTHVPANGYANAWYITPVDIGGRRDYTLILELTRQRSFYIGLSISIVGFAICLSLILMLLLRKFRGNE